MKLTKGKLSKIQNKKKQSLKRYKKGGKTYKSKTFRKRKHLNLHNTSLKKYKGGDGETSEAKPATDELEAIQTVPLTQETVQPLQEETVQPLQEEVKPAEEVKPLQEETLQPSAEEEVKPLQEEVKPAAETEQSSVEEQQQMAPLKDAATEEPMSSDPGEGPGSHQPLPPPVSEEGSTESEIATNNSDDAASGSVTESEFSSTVEPPKFDSEPVASSSAAQESSPSIAAESLDNLLDYISTKIAQKLKQSSFGSASNSELNKDSFNSVADASETLAEA